MKKIYLSVIALFCLTSLTACHIPIINKTITIPFFEKKPDKVLKLMVEKMAEVNTMEFDSKTSFNINLSSDSLSKASVLSKDYFSVISQNSVKVLGIDNLTSADYEAPNRLSIISPISDDFDMDFPGSPAPPPPSFLGLGREAIDFTLFFDAKGKVDQADKDNPRQETNLKIGLDYSIFNIEAKLDTVFVDDTPYLYLHPLPLTFLPKFLPPEVLDEVEALMEEITSRWWKLDMEEFEEKIKKELSQLEGFNGEMAMFEEIIKDTFDKEKQKETSLKIQEKATASFKKNPIIKVDQRLRDEKIDEKKCYRYKVSLDKDNLNLFMSDMIVLYLELIEDQIKSLMPGGSGINIKADEVVETEEFVNQFIEAIVRADGEVWIDKKDFYLRKSDFQFVLDFSKVIDNKAGESKDTRRVSDMRQLQTALELDFNDNQRYAEKLEDVKKYIFSIPTSLPNNGDCPKNFDYIYQVEEDGKDYKIIFCLGGKTGNLESGYNVLTPAGFEAYRGEDIKIDFIENDDDKEASSSSDKSFLLTIKNKTEYKNFNQPMDIKAPEKSASLVDYVWEKYTESLEKARARSRDAKRVADMRQMQTVFELYYNENQRYPDAPADAKKYIFQTPTNPLPNDGGCPEDFKYAYKLNEDGQDFELIFCLGYDIGLFKAGYNAVTPKGIDVYQGDLAQLVNIFENAQARDEKRVSDMKQLQTALELDFNDHQRYAGRLAGASKYLSEIPVNPRPNDGNCPKDFEYIYLPDKDGNEYELIFCLGNQTGKLEPGFYKTTPAGFSEQPFTHDEIYDQLEALKLIDSDNDGLSDYDEIMIWGTDPFDPDTDGDGYLDGDEVKAGYDPLGPGKLE